ncbi:ABC transporter ATP-binding protein [Peribacillus frigoritolerans]|uniref:ATP-binding cassette domain-containing protein n=1 Tax=Peribacillus frigoritolerans TaxID=450367 RepID=UPI0020BF4913|nr:ABC transporter ATP-binding protein [Peribacillus frigoritolerans]MCK2003754.1 ABC transporter ATP-binding protein [Peribacillus frigoritolerans]MEE3954658.1 ABC transporter ATP-binding protein [Peribacillus frigoritolerans]
MTIKIRNLNKRIKNNILFENLNFDLIPGEIYGIIGKNGTGKTTLLKLLSGLVPDDRKQTIDLFPDQYSPIGIHLENPKIYPYLSGKQNIRLFTSDLLEPYYDADLLIKKFQLEKFIDKKVKTYSLGTKQKISLIIAILMSGKLLLLDEPTNGLDEESIKTFKSILLQLSKEYKLTILITTHDVHELEEVFDKMMTIKNGSLETVDLPARKKHV